MKLNKSHGNVTIIVIIFVLRNANVASFVLKWLVTRTSFENDEPVHRAFYSFLRVATIRTRAQQILTFSEIVAYLLSS
jgi:hypothetical protein